MPALLVELKATPGERWLVQARPRFTVQKRWKFLHFDKWR
jgi:hypothetical protein